MAKHFFYLTNTQLTATLWDKGTLSPGRTFDNFPSGFSQFAEYLLAYRDVPAYLLTDLIEEDFQRENIPHVFGSAKRSLIERRLLNLYRDTPFRKATFQGRETTGRKDDQMLFSGLTNPLLITPWLDVLLRERIDLVGIYSIALLNPLVAEKLAFGNEATLLVTHQSSGWRQSFFENGYLRFSRLAPETAWSAEAIAETGVAEIGRTRQFLASTRLIARDAAIRIVVLANPDIVGHLLPLCQNLAGASYQFVQLDEAQKIFKATALGPLIHCDALFLSLLGTKHIDAHYAKPEQQRFHQLIQVRSALNALSIAAVAGGVIWAFANGLSALQANQQTHEAQLATQDALTRYQQTANSMPVTVANPHDMKAAVGLAQMIEQNKPRMDQILVPLSHALDVLPQITIHDLQWQTSDTEGAPQAADASQLPPGEEPPIVPMLVGVPTRPFEVLTLNAEVSPFTNDYRTALESVRQLIAELQKDSHIHAELSKPPLDVRPTVKLEGKAGDDAELAKPLFSLKVMWRP